MLTFLFVLFVAFISSNLIVLRLFRNEPIQFSMVLFYIPYLLSRNNRSYKEWVKQNVNNLYSIEVLYKNDQIRRFLFSEYNYLFCSAFINEIRINHQKDEIFVYIYCVYPKKVTQTKIDMIEIELFDLVKKKVSVITIQQNI
jgi:hypothetical protein